MERINPTNDVRIGGLSHYIAVWKPGTIIIDPDTGGLVPGPPTEVMKMFAAIEPIDLSSLQEQLAAGGALTAIAGYTVTAWYRPELTLEMYLDYWDEGLKRTRQLEIVAIRDPQQNHRYTELLCKERVES